MFNPAEYASVVSNVERQYLDTLDPPERSTDGVTKEEKRKKQTKQYYDGLKAAADEEKRLESLDTAMGRMTLQSALGAPGNYVWARSD